MATVVMKFGGASVASTAHFSRIAKIIIDSRSRYVSVAVVISAMGGTTDQLIRLANEVHSNPPRRELDMLITVGERISIALLAMALDLAGHTAISFTSSQSSIITCNRHTEARILEVKPHRLKPHLKEGKTVIVAGFQGVSGEGQITTLGRGVCRVAICPVGVRRLIF
jgi:aspartate kinase